jgi:hypothetical protein
VVLFSIDIRRVCRRRPASAERSAFLFFLRAFASAAADAAAAAATALQTPQTPPPTLAARLSSHAAALAAFAPALLRPPPRARLLYALKMTGSVLAAAALGQLTSGSGQWAAIGVQIVGARDGVFFGGPFRTAALRIAGTAAGVLFAALLLASDAAVAPHVAPPPHGRQTRPLAPLLAPLALWTALWGPVRAGNPLHAYAAMVAQYTPHIILFDPNAAVKGRAFAYTRIEQNLLGLGVFCVIELCFAPQRASAALPRAAVGVLRDGAAALRRAACGGGRCDAAAAAAAAAALARARAGVARTRALLTEAAAEPGAPRHARLDGWSRLADAQEGRLMPALALMGTTCDAADAMSSSSMAATHALRERLRALLAALADDVESSADGSGGATAPSPSLLLPLSPPQHLDSVLPHRRVSSAGACSTAAAVSAALFAAEEALAAAEARAVSAGVHANTPACTCTHAALLCARQLLDGAHALAHAARGLRPAPPLCGDDDGDDVDADEEADASGAGGCNIKSSLHAEQDDSAAEEGSGRSLGAPAAAAAAAEAAAAQQQWGVCACGAELRHRHGGGSAAVKA